MLVSVCLGTNNLKKAGEFYDVVLGTLKMSRLVTVDIEIGYGKPDGPVSFWVLTPFNKEPATFGNGTQVIFGAETRQQVHAFYEAALQHGGISEGEPGPRDYSAGYYGAYVRDIDGNKLHVSVMGE